MARLRRAAYVAGFVHRWDLRRPGLCPCSRSAAADIETFARELEALGRARATVTRRLCTIAGSCKYAVEEELLDHSPAAHARRPRLDYESRATALDRSEPGALLAAAGLGAAAEHALLSLLALNGLRVSEATGADSEHLGLERGHRTLVITRKGGKVVTIPLAPRTARATGLAIGERTEGPLFVAADGGRLDRHGAARIVRRVTRRAGIAKHVGRSSQVARARTRKAVWPPAVARLSATPELGRSSHRTWPLAALGNRRYGRIPDVSPPFLTTHNWCLRAGHRYRQTMVGARLGAEDSHRVLLSGIGCRAWC